MATCGDGTIKGVLPREMEGDDAQIRELVIGDEPYDAIGE